MWIIFLDCSGSMGDPFEAEHFQFKGRVRRATAQVKLEEAKRAVILQLRQLDESTEVVLFGFTTKVEEICKGLAGEVTRFEQKLSPVDAHDGTDIAAALNHAVSYVAAYPSLAVKPAVLLISDGKSDLDKAKAAARNCIGAGIRVDMIVIDPTEKGVEMAKAIVRIAQGRWEPVASAEDMQRSTGEAAGRFAREAAQAEAVVRQAENEFAADREQAKGRPEVSFTVGYAKLIERARRYPMHVYAHVSERLAEVKELLRKQLVALGDAFADSTAEESLPLARGRLITVQPNIRNIFVNPPRQEVIWTDDYHGLEFQYSYAGRAACAEDCEGSVDILVDGLIVAQIPVSIRAVAEKSSAAHAQRVETVRMLSNIFASYAHEDESLVRACKAYYRTLGIHLYVDRDELLSGEAWRATLAGLIKRSDLFQLYWSQAAADSSEVAREWQLALSFGIERPWNFIRPLYWQKPMPPAPAELQKINFGFLDLNRLKVDLEAAIHHVKNRPAARVEQVSALFPVIPLEGSNSDTVSHLQEALKRVVPFLENLTGLRYYPSPTLLVDEYTVTQIRNHVTIDRSADELSEGDIGWALQVAQSLALAFHVSNPGSTDEEARRVYELRSAEELDDYRHVRKMCEYTFSGPVAAYLSGDDPFRDRGEKYVEELKGYVAKARDDYSTYSLERMLRNTLNAATPQDRREMEGILGGPLPDMHDLAKQANPRRNYSMSDTPARRAQFNQVLERIESAEFLSLAMKCISRFSQLFDGRPTTLQRSLDFPTYLGKFFELWQTYAQISAKNTEDQIVQIGYRVHVAALENLARHFPDIRFTFGRTQPGRSNEPECEWSLTRRDFCRTVVALKAVIMRAAGRPPDGRRVVRESFLATVATFGVFVSARVREAAEHLEQLARRSGWPSAVSLAGSHKTLLSMTALERYHQRLLKSGLDKQTAERMKWSFLTATLVHEHFHGIAESGVDRRGQASSAWDGGGWEKGSNLNEALAAWTERHFFRDDPEMFRGITEYINEGEYPEWPYRGAELIERIFQEKGLPAVRALTGQLRDDPDFAQENFDALFCAS